jgi:four helix bundle protein
MAQNDGSTVAAAFEKLIVWRKAHAFVLAVYHVTRLFPAEERFGLTSQFRRAAVSVAANIAEGHRKRSKADKIRLLNVAEGSLSECRYYLILARDLGYTDPAALIDTGEEVSRLLYAYSRAIAESVHP